MDTTNYAQIAENDRELAQYICVTETPSEEKIAYKDTVFVANMLYGQRLTDQTLEAAAVVL